MRSQPYRYISRPFRRRLAGVYSLEPPLVRPLITILKVVHVGPWQLALVLEHANNDPRMNSSRSSELADRLFAQGTWPSKERIESAVTYEDVLGELVSLFLKSMIAPVRFIVGKDHVALMEKYVTSLMAK